MRPATLLGQPVAPIRLSRYAWTAAYWCCLSLHLQLLLPSQLLQLKHAALPGCLAGSFILPAQLLSLDSLSCCALLRGTWGNQKLESQNQAGAKAVAGIEQSKAHQVPWHAVLLAHNCQTVAAAAVWRWSSAPVALISCPAWCNQCLQNTPCPTASGAVVESPGVGRGGGGCLRVKHVPNGVEKCAAASSNHAAKSAAASAARFLGATAARPAVSHS